jgi:hypothetical protein
MFIDGLDYSGVKNFPCKPRGGREPCHGCGNHSEARGCIVADTNKQAAYFRLLDTMTGCSSLRLRFDGQPTEMEKLIMGDTVNDGDGMDSEHTVDFLFGFTGYKYRKITDAAAFKDEIAKSIDAGKPVLAKTKSGQGRFHVITGYDGDTLICPSDDYFYKRARPEAPAYDEIVTLYIFGDKTAPRYTLRDGLENIRRVRKYNVNQKLWDEYLVKMGGWDAFPSHDGLDKADMEEKKTRLQRMADVIWHTYNTHFFRHTFRDCRHEKMLNPALSKSWEMIKKQPNGMPGGEGLALRTIGKINWDTIRASTFARISKKICEAIVKITEADINVLEIIDQAIEILEDMI